MFETRSVRCSGGALRGAEFGYRLLCPQRVEPGREYPLVLCLHGAGERGDDNRAQLAHLPAAFAERRREYPCFVLAPQCRSDHLWVDAPWDERGSVPQRELTPMLGVALSSLDQVLALEPVDRRRIYVVGLSMGGYGAWDLATRYPGWFAAAVPICGSGDVRRAAELAGVPVWAFHGALDRVVPVEGSRAMIDAIRRAGGAPRYTEFEAGGHDAWTPACAQPELYEWLFAQSRATAGSRDAAVWPAATTAWIPWPARVSELGREVVAIGPAARISAGAELAPLASIVRDEIEAVSGLRLEVGEADGDIELTIDDGRVGHRLELDDRITAAGATYRDVAHATATLLQSLVVVAGKLIAPRVRIEDRPAADYRGVMIDCARHPQSIATLEQVVEMCRLYKIGFLQLHLTDDAAFTFPARSLPGVATPGRHYRWAELEALERFARDRGVAIVPELDVPGHSAALVSARPELGISQRERNPSLLRLGSPAVDAALDRLIGEMCSIFRTSPYFHVGGDEVDLTGLDDDPEALAYMRERGLADTAELFHDFLSRLHGIVARYGKRTIVWEGFRGRRAIPGDVIVAAWDTSFRSPADLLADGHPVINASWRPLYIAGGGGEEPKRWSARDIYAWHLRRWDHHSAEAPSFGGLEVGDDLPIFGAQMCVWEQREESVVPDLRERLAAFAERVWSSGCRSYADYARRFAHVGRRVDRLLGSE